MRTHSERARSRMINWNEKVNATNVDHFSELRSGKNWGMHSECPQQNIFMCMVWCFHMKRKTLGIHNFMIRFCVSVCMSGCVYLFRSHFDWWCCCCRRLYYSFSHHVCVFLSFRCCRLNVYFEHISFTQGCRSASYKRKVRLSVWVFFSLSR